MNRLVRQISLSFAAVLIVVYSATSMFLHFRMQNAVEEAAIPPIDALTKLLMVRMAEVPTTEYEQLVLQLEKELETPVDLLLLDSPDIPEYVRGRLKKKLAATEPSRDFGGRFFIPAPNSEHVLVVGPGPPFRPISRTEFVTMLILLLLVVLGTGWALARPITKKLKLLETTAARIAGGQLTARAQVSGNDPIGAFAARFNQMAERNQETLEKRSQLLQAVSHELRTPAACIRFGLEMLPEAENDAERAKRIESIEADVQELDDLVEELLLYNRLESQIDMDEHKPIALVPVIEQILTQVQPLRPEVSIAFDGEATADLTLKGSPKLFGRALRNLVTNALRHAQSRVVISAANVGEWIEIAVRDDGPGVPRSRRQEILEPFARLDESRSRELGGVGLGLAIVQRIVQSHHAELSIEDAKEGGAIFITRWLR
ncbi:MAG: HAMP domain-containing protein [Deltaproteobacteria bacterium]|nr:HAMP domain-containing protein [Deltaproteobacteria bacterium]